MPAPYDGKWYWVQFKGCDEPAIAVWYEKNWLGRDGEIIESDWKALAYQPFIEPQPYVESE
jgi:hypothetical protein